MDTGEVIQPIKKRKRRKKQPWQIVLKDRFLTNEKPENPYLVALLYFFVFFMSFLLVFVCFFQLCEVHKTSMMDTLHNGDRVLLLKEVSTYKRGDIVVIQKGKNRDINIIKRIIGVAGDTLMFTEDKEKNDGTILLLIKKKGKNEFTVYNEPYIKEPMKSDWEIFKDFTFDEEINVPADHVYVMGDNREVSEDSRGKDGPYPIASICGKSILKIKKGSLLEFFLKFLYRNSNSIS